MSYSANSLQASQQHRSCVSCCRDNEELLPIPETTMLFLEKNNLLENGVTNVCKHCLADFEGFKSNPGNYLQKKKEEMHEKRIRWLNRIQILKSAYQNFRAKKFKESKELYIEYIKTIEMCVGVSLREINSEMFAKSGREDEINPFTLSLWDMVVISDKETQPPTAELTMYVAKFIEFSKNSISRKTIIHTIKKYKREAKNKKIFKQMLIDLGSNGGCFIVSYAYGNPYSPEVLLWREFRDNKLMPYSMGRLFVNLYYRLSPCLIKLLPQGGVIQTGIRVLLQKLSVYILRDKNQRRKSRKPSPKKTIKT